MDVWIADVGATIAPLQQYRCYGYPN